MKIVNLQCPNCGARLTVENNMYVCNSCGTTIAIDYDESDVEYERLKTEPERDQRRFEHDRALLERQYELREQETIAAQKRLEQQERRETAARVLRTLIIFACIFTFIAVCAFFSVLTNKIAGRKTIIDDIEELTATPMPTATPTPGPNYRITPELISEDLDVFIETGRLAQMKIDQCGVMNENGVVHFYDKTDAVFLDAYIVSGIPYVDEDESCRLVLIYEVTWHNDDYGDQTCYDAIYFDGIKVAPDDKIVSDYFSKTIWRSDAAWGWGMAYSFENYSQCYLENVKALGGKIEEVRITHTDTTETDVEDDSDSEEDAED